MLSLEMLTEVYMMTAVNQKKATDTPRKIVKELPKLEVGDLVLLKNHKKNTPWDAKYISTFCICKIINYHALDFQDLSVHEH